MTMSPRQKHGESLPILPVFVVRKPRMQTFMYSKLITFLTGSVLALTALDAAAQTCPAPQPSGICNRACWAARAPNCTITTMSTLNRVILHHTAVATHWNTTSIDTSKPSVRSIQNYHMDNNGWCDIGYHFVIDKFGNIFEGRYNSMTQLTRGIIHADCVTDNFNFTLMGYCHTPYNNDPSATCRGRIYDLIAWRMPAGWSPYGSDVPCTTTVGKVAGHRNVSATACPGDIFYNNYITANYSGGDARNGIAARRTCAIILDNPSATFVGTWATGTTSTDRYGADFRWRSHGTGASYGTFTPNIVTAGNYQVWEWHPQGTNRATDAKHTVNHAGGSTLVNVNQQINGGKWNLLGTFNFAAGTSGNVRIADNHSDSTKVVTADAIRFVYVP
jgi:hypothetical protein